LSDSLSLTSQSTVVVVVVVVVVVMTCRNIRLRYVDTAVGRWLHQR
jgi:hypothetical protein